MWKPESISRSRLPAMASCEREIEALIKQYGLSSRVQITGWISSDEVRQRILDARALVLPSFAEGLPVVIMEAMALRRPVISTYVAGIPELVHDGEHGWLVPAGDVDALVQAIQQCLKSSHTRLQTIGEAAHGRVIQRHHVSTEAAKLASYLEAACQLGSLNRKRQGIELGSTGTKGDTISNDI